MVLKYFGKAYHGWQRQPNAISVQQVLEDAMSTQLRETISITGAGRTDTGVHAKKMVAHFETNTSFKAEDLVYSLNAFLPEDISINQIYPVPDDAHARFDATERTYEYWIVKEKDPFFKDTAYCHRQPLNLSLMNQAASQLLDYDDFKAFSKSGTDVKTYQCKITSAFWEERGSLLIFTISADRFLRNMVRAVVGTLLEIGTEKTPLSNLKTIINSGDRAQAGASVPAKGLYLTEIRYPKKLNHPNG